MDKRIGFQNGWTAVGGQAVSQGASASVIAPITATLPQAASVVLRLQTDTITPVADGTSISSWTDSASGLVFNATAGKLPVYKVNQQGSAPSLRFSGAQEMFAVIAGSSLKTAVDSQEYTIMAIYKNPTQTAGNLGAVFASNNGATPPGIFANATYQGVYQTGWTKKAAPKQDNNFTTCISTSSKTPAYSGGGTGIARTYVNGSCLTSDIVPGAITTGSNNFFVGAAATATFPYIGDVFAVLTWNRALTPTEAMQAHMWACDYYSVAYPFAPFNEFIVVDSNSLKVALNGTVNRVAESSFFKEMVGLSRPYGSYTMTAVQGITWTGMSAKAGAEVDAFRSLVNKTLVVNCGEWPNSRNTYTTVVGQADAYRAARKSANPDVKIAFYTSTVMAASFGNVADRNSYNANYDNPANRTNIDAYVDIHNNPNIGPDSAAPTVGAGGTYFDNDGIHCLPAGYTEWDTTERPKLATLLTN